MSMLRVSKIKSGKMDISEVLVGIKSFYHGFF